MKEYHIGLGKGFLVRARLIFILSLLILIAALGTVGYVGAKTGEFDRVIFAPLQNFLASLNTVEEQPPLPPEIIPPPTTIKDQKVVPQGRSVQKIQPSPTPAIIYQQPTLGEFPSDWAKQQSEASRRNLEEFTRQSQQKLDEFIKQGAQGFEDFRKQNSQ